MREGQAKVLSDDELKRVYAVARSGRHGQRNVVLLDFSYLLGLRVKELASLRIENFTDADGNIMDSFFLTAEQSKGHKGRTIYLTNKKLRKNLQIYLDTRVGDPNNKLFKSQKSSFTPNSLQQVFKRLYRSAGIKGAKSHSGRRFFATRLIEYGSDLKSVSVLLGHKSVVTTGRYINDNPIRLGEMVANL